MKAMSTSFLFGATVLLILLSTSAAAGQSSRDISGLKSEHDVTDAQTRPSNDREQPKQRDFYFPTPYEYTCLTAEETEFIYINCKQGFYIDEIPFAYYGIINTTCPDVTYDERCSIRADEVYDRCLKQKSCYVPAVNDLFGDPCPRNKKTLAVMVLCVAVPTPSFTQGPTALPSAKPTASPSRTVRPSRSPSSTKKPTRAPTPSKLPSSPSSTHLPSYEPSATRSPSKTRTPSASGSPTLAPTHTRKPSKTPTSTKSPPTVTPKPRPDHEPTSTRPASPSKKPSSAPSSTRSPSKTPTPSRSPSKTSSPSRLPSKTHLPSQTRSATPSPTQTRSPTRTASRTFSATRKPSSTRSFSRTPSRTRSPSKARTRSRARTPSASPTVSAGPPPLNTPLCGECLQYTIGLGEVVKEADPRDPDYPDQALAVVRLPNGDFRGYSALGGTDLIIAGPNLTNRVFVGLNIRASVPNYYTHDMEGVWWDPVYKVLRGWVHIETHVCEINAGYFHGEIYYVESRDGGYKWYPSIATYQPPDAYFKCPIEYPGWVYPYPVFSKDWTVTSGGRIRKTPAQIEEVGTKNSGTGAHWNVQIGDYLYTYYTDYWAEELPDEMGHIAHTYGTCVARAPTWTGGTPGNWTKWYNGSWSEPGVNGRCHVPPGIAGTATTEVTIKNTGEKIFINIPPNWAGFMSATLDGLTFSRLNGPFLPSLRPNINQIQNARPWFLGYQSIIVDEHDQPWLYGMSVLTDIGMRQIVRYPITFYQTHRKTNCGGRVGLARYHSLTGNAVSVSLQMRDHTKWDQGTLVAYTSCCYSRTVINLYECNIVKTKTRFLAIRNECDVTARSPDNTDSALQYMGGAGYLSSQYVSGLGALWRCWYPGSNGRGGYFDAILVEFTAQSPCERTGGISQLMMGYAMAPGSEGLSPFARKNPFWDNSTQPIVDPRLVTPIPVPTYGAQTVTRRPTRTHKPSGTPTRRPTRPTRTPTPTVTNRSATKRPTRPTRTRTPSATRRPTRKIALTRRRSAAAPGAIASPSTTFLKIATNRHPAKCTTPVIVAPKPSRKPTKSPSRKRRTRTKSTAKPRRTKTHRPHREASSN